MRLLLDTHVALWAITDDKRLTQTARDLISERTNEVFVSVISLWEIAIKFALRRGDPDDMPLSAGDARHEFNAAGYMMLDLSPDHVLALESLPLLHADPFDRILVAQALTEPLRLLTHDRRTAQYSDTITHV